MRQDSSSEEESYRTCVDILLLLPYVDVYEKPVIQKACEKFRKICASNGDLWGEVACVAVSALFREAIPGSWTRALNEVR